MNSMGKCAKCNGIGCTACQSLEKLENIDSSLGEASGNLEAMSGQLDGLIDAQYETADAISEGLGIVAGALDEGFSALRAQFDEQIGALSDICSVLENPRATQADELRRMADEMRRRNVLPKAQEAYLESLELNPLDYRAYIGIAETKIKQNALEEAKKYVEQSLPHAPKSKSFDWKSYSYRILAHIAIRENDPPGAINHLHSAIQHTSGYGEGLYELAQFCAIAQKKDECLNALQTAITLNPGYFASAQQGNFFGARPQVHALLQGMHAAAGKELKSAIISLEKRMSKAYDEVAKAEEWRERANEGGRCESVRKYESAVVSLGGLKKASGYEQAINAIQKRVPQLQGEISDVITKTIDEQNHYKSVRKTKVKSAWAAVPRAIFANTIVSSCLGGMTGYVSGCMYFVSQPQPNVPTSEGIALGSSLGVIVGAMVGLLIGVYQIRKKLK